jgi:hypothetical protein
MAGLSQERGNREKIKREMRPGAGEKRESGSRALMSIN